jgi:hypothetical protein
MTTVVFNWSPLVTRDREPDQSELPRSLPLPHVPRAGDYLDFDDEMVGVVKHVTWDLQTGWAYVYVDVP